MTSFSTIFDRMLSNIYSFYPIYSAFCLSNISGGIDTIFKKSIGGVMPIFLSCHAGERSWRLISKPE